MDKIVQRDFQLAHAIAKAIFTDGRDRMASRLVMEFGDEGTRLDVGWSLVGLRFFIATELHNYRERDSDDWDGAPVGWEVIAVGDDGSILCRSPSGRRARFWLGPDGRD